jgi:hypothetical protein
MKIPSQSNFEVKDSLFGRSSRVQFRPMNGLLLTLVAACVLMCGCAAARLKADYRTYERSYAEGSNRQMLLNLARLDQHHPTYFFKLGQISTSYRMIAGFPGNAQFSPQGNIGGVTGGGTPSLSYEQDPQFTFIPVNDDAMAQQLLKPVPAEFFYMFYQQGWRVDQLLRLMVDRVEIRAPGNEVQIIRNGPSSDDDAVDSYVTFLRICAIALELQRRGYLVLGGENRFVPVAKGWSTKDLPAVKDFLDSMTKNADLSKTFVWRKTADGTAWEMGRETVVPIFRLNLPEDTEKNKNNTAHQNLVKEIMDGYQADLKKDLPQLDGKPLKDPKSWKHGQKEASLETTLFVLRCGFKLQETVSPEPASGDDPCLSAHLVMRSLIGMMTAAAQEQPRFDELSNNAHFRFIERVPVTERQPLIRITSWPDNTQLTEQLVSLDYLGKTYTVADPVNPSKLDDISFWNRDVFRIISQLASQVTVDISKFPLPEILQIRTQ